MTGNPQEAAASYLEEGVTALRKAQSAAANIRVDQRTAAELYLRIGEALILAAAVEKGLLPPEMVPAPGRETPA